MIIDAWWMNLITMVLVIVLYICALVLYLHMNKAQQKEDRNIALLSVASVFFGLVLIVLLTDIGLEYTRDKRSEAEKNRDALRNMMKAPAPPPMKPMEDNDYGTVRKS